MQVICTLKCDIKTLTLFVTKCRGVSKEIFTNSISECYSAF